MDNKKNKIEKLKKELFDSYERNDILENNIFNNKIKYDELLAKYKVLENDILNKNNLIIELETKLFDKIQNNDDDIKHKDKLIDDLKIKLVQKNDLIFQLENKICNLHSEIKKIEINTNLKNKLNKKDLLVPLLEISNESCDD